MPVAVTHLLGPDQGGGRPPARPGGPLHDRRRAHRGRVQPGRAPAPAAGARRPPAHPPQRGRVLLRLQGRFGVQLGDDSLEAGPGDLLFKPRGVPHAFWNAGDEPARLLELISPAGFEHYFRELAPLLATPERDQAAIDQVVARYQLDIDFTTIPTLAEQHHLRLG